MTFLFLYNFRSHGWIEEFNYNNVKIFHVIIVATSFIRQFKSLAISCFS